jgi:sugar phosphate isomerase/epimerase
MARTELWDKLAQNSIIAAAAVECPYVVVHPLIMPDRRYDVLYKENFDLNLEYYGKMKDSLKKYGVKVAIENMWHFDDDKNTICPSVCSSAEEMLELAKTLGDEFDTCLDVGHALLTGRTPESMVYILGDRLATLHVHDNDGKADQHRTPGEGTIDWVDFSCALEEIGFDGCFSYETGVEYNIPEGEERDRLERELAQTAHRIAKNIK